MANPTDKATVQGAYGRAPHGPICSRMGRKTLCYFDSVRSSLLTPALFGALVACDTASEKRSDCAEGWTMGSLGYCIASDTGTAPNHDTGEAEPLPVHPDQSPGAPQHPSARILPPNCTAPGGLSGNPISEGAAIEVSESYTTQLLELAVEPERNLLWAVGQGGLQAFDVSDPAAPTPLGMHPDHGEALYHHLHLLPPGDAGEGMAYATHREIGLTVINIEDPTAMYTVWEGCFQDLAGMVQIEDALYVANQMGSVQVFDITDRRSPTMAGAVHGLENPMAIAASEEAIYVADPQLGLITFDRSDPFALEQVDLTVLPGVIDLAISDDHIVAAQGTHGVSILSRANPLAPEVLTQMDFGSPVKAVAIDAGMAWVVDIEGIRAIDVKSVLKPELLGMMPTDEWAVDVVALGERAWVADWSHLRSFSADATVLAPHVTLDHDQVLFDIEGDSRRITIRNDGNATLSLTGATTNHEALKVTFSAESVGPRGTQTLELRWGGGELPDGELCLATNDPDQPILRLPIHTGGGGRHPEIGNMAPDFALNAIAMEMPDDPDLGSVDLSKRLLDELGHPVLMTFTSIHDPICPLILADIEQTLHQPYQDAGLRVWALTNDTPFAVTSTWQAYALTFDVLYDPDDDVKIQYMMDPAFSATTYPQHWLIGADGRIVFASNTYDPDQLVALIEQEL